MVFLLNGSFVGHITRRVPISLWSHIKRIVLKINMRLDYAVVLSIAVTSYREQDIFCEKTRDKELTEDWPTATLESYANVSEM